MSYNFSADVAARYWAAKEKAGWAPGTYIVVTVDRIINVTYECVARAMVEEYEGRWQIICVDSPDEPRRPG